MKTARIGILLVCFIAVAFCGEDPADGWYAEQRTLYGGIPVTVRFAPADTTLAAEAWALLAAIDDDFNDWRDDSHVGRINAGGPGSYELNPSLAEAFALSERMHAASSGVFDITVGPLRRLWRGAEKARRWPEQAEIDAVRARIGDGAYVRDGARLTVLKAGVQFDFGGVCKGMAVDRAVALLRGAGRRAGLVQVGGETGCWGTAAAGRPYRIGIPDPDAPDDPDRLVARLQDPGQGLCGSTSGNYRNPIVVAGRTLYHVYDPRTGMPAPTRTLSSSVVFPGTGRNGEADCLAKTGELLPPDEFLALIAGRGGEAMLLLRGADGASERRTTAGWDALTIRPQEAP
ncbi:MAG: FAD:protein FMN transferase [Planctomycetes bacterium]|nr:FAD:protein FMN transferase [Planctomycetota bacterium]